MFSKINRFSNQLKSYIKKPHDNGVFLNTLLFALMQIFIISYSIIRFVLMDIYVGVTNYGLLSLIITVAPIAVVFISASQAKSLYVLYKFTLAKDYINLNKMINEQINEMKKNSFISLFSVIGLMIFSYFLVKSPELTNLISLLLVFAATIELLSMGIIVPYVQWYLNSIYKNYIFDFFSLIFSTIFNLISFLIIGLYGAHIFTFNAIHSKGDVYITLIVSFLISIRNLSTNLVLLFLRKKWMPWFKRIKSQKNNFLDKNYLSYLGHDFLAWIAGLLIPIVLYIFSTFIPLATSIAGIYYSYMTFAKFIIFTSMILGSLKPYLAAFFQQDNQNKLFELNYIIYKCGFFLMLFFSFNLIIIIPYIMIFTKSYFSFILAFLMIINIFISGLKSIDENFIYLHGKPEKYIYLTLIEIIVGIISMIIGFSIIFTIQFFLNNIMNILYCLIICEIILRFTKYNINIYYLNKFVYKISFKKYIKEYYKLYIIFCLFIITVSLVLSLSIISKDQSAIFTNNITLKVYSKENINLLFIDDINLINWKDLFCFWFILNLFFLSIIFIYLYFFDKNYLQEIMRIISKYKIILKNKKLEAVPKS